MSVSIIYEGIYSLRMSQHSMRGTTVAFCGILGGRLLILAYFRPIFDPSDPHIPQKRSKHILVHQLPSYMTLMSHICTICPIKSTIIPDLIFRKKSLRPIAFFTFKPYKSLFCNSYNLEIIFGGEAVNLWEITQSSHPPKLSFLSLKVLHIFVHFKHKMYNSLT